MAEPLALLHRRAQNNWLIGLDQTRLLELAVQRLQMLQALQWGDRSLTIALSESDPTCFLAGFIAACTFPNSHLFLCNPSWRSQEWRQVEAIEQPDVLWKEGRSIAKDKHQGQEDCPSLIPRRQPKILIPTGGSSGQIRFATHTWDTLTASVKGFCAYFEIDRVHSCCTLPLYHVSGLMQFLRSFLTGGQLACPGSLEAASLDFHPADFFLSLVPTQLQRLLSNSAACDRLSQFHTVLLGGAPAWEELLEQSRRRSIRLAPTYGMTETASQVATLKPEDFLQGRSGCGRVLPHAQIQIRNGTGQDLNPNEVGMVTLRAESLALGYYPDYFTDAWFQTDDLGYFDSNGILHLVGRNSQKIITGGENVFPQEVEAAIRATGLVKDVCVLGMPDADWGEAVTAIYVPIDSPDPTALAIALKPRITPYKQPKCWIALDQIPRNAQGKIDRKQIKQMIRRLTSL